MSKFKVGNKVEVIYWGNLYSTFESMARELKLRKWKSGGGYYENPLFCHGGKIGKVIAEKNGYVGVRIDGRDYIISQEGLKLTNKKMETNKRTTKPKAQFKVGEIINNDNAGQKSKILEVHYDKELEDYKYLVLCLDDSGSLHLEEEDSLSEIEIRKVTVAGLKEHYEETEEVQVEIIK